MDEFTSVDGWPGLLVHDRWPTADGVIPWKLFLLLMTRLPLRRARRQADLASLVAIGSRETDEASAALLELRREAEYGGP